MCVVEKLCIVCCVQNDVLATIWLNNERVREAIHANPVNILA